MEVRRLAYQEYLSSAAVTHPIQAKYGPTNPSQFNPQASIPAFNCLEIHYVFIIPYLHRSNDTGRSKWSGIHGQVTKHIEAFYFSFVWKMRRNILTILDNKHILFKNFIIILSSNLLSLSTRLTSHHLSPVRDRLAWPGQGGWREISVRGRG